MNAIRLLRSTVGLTQRELAVCAKTSQPTIAAYESDAKSPTMSTLRRLADALELDLVISYVPRLTREDRRSLVYHRAIAQKLQQHARPVIQHARRVLRRMRRQNPYATSLFDRWSRWLDLPSDALVLQLLDPGLTAREMRQVSPFAGILQPQERRQILQRFRGGEDA